MTSSNHPRTPVSRSSGLRRAGMMAALALATILHGSLRAQPASGPLLTTTEKVRPNLLFVLDTSGSMDESEVYANHYQRASGSCNNQDVAKWAPVNNLLHYDPAKTYEPRVDSNGNSLPPGPQPWVLDRSYLDLYRPKSGQNIQSLTSKADICDASRYELVRIRMRQGNAPYTASTESATVAGAVYTAGNGNPLSTSRSLADERKNIANWAAYHSRRIDAAKTGVAAAFAGQADTFRLGYTTIYVDPADGSGTGNAKLWGVKDYGLAKSDFYTWLQGLSPNGATPLRRALDRAGQYYSRTDNNGPWAHRPWLANSNGETAAEHLSCRRNFTILVTDGEWNGNVTSTNQVCCYSAGPRLNVDGTMGPLHIDASGVQSYRYIPRDTDPRSIGKADGPSGDGYPETLADVAMYYWVNDLRTDLPNNASKAKPTDPPFWQNMTVYTAAFGATGILTPAEIKAAREGQINWTAVQPITYHSSDPRSDLKQPQNIDDLIHAAHNGGGQFLELTDAASFASKLGDAIASIARSDTFSEAGVAASAVALTTNTRKFVPYYISNQWWGNVKMVNLKVNGDEGETAWEVVTTVDGQPTGETRIPAPDVRKIYTWSPGTGAVEFRWPQLNNTTFKASSPASNTSTLLHNSVTTAEIDYLRGKRDGEGGTFRRREAILGDIVNSTPVFVKNNTNFGYERLEQTTPGFSEYSNYMQEKSLRAEGVLFVGANDGMAHAFREGTDPKQGGAEVFAFVPQGVLGNLHELTRPSYQHRYFVDGPLTEADAYIDAPNLGAGPSTVKRWTNLVVGTAGAGGRTVFALDVTRPLAMNEKSVLWEANFRSTGMGNLGYVMSPIETGITASGDWVAILGNGPYGASGQAHLFILNLATGNLIKQINTDNATGNGLGGVRVVRNANSRIVGVYAGDLKGNVWRFDLSAASKASWPDSGQLLFTAKDPGGNPQPITARPGVIPRADKWGGYMVVVGTGKLYDTGDNANQQQQAAYGLWDKATFGGTATFSAIGNAGELVVVTAVLGTSSGTTTGTPTATTSYYRTTASRTVDWAVDRGWVLRYDLLAGQRTIFSVEPTKAVVRIDTVAPRINQTVNACQRSTAPGINYLVQPLTGTCRADATFDLNGDGNFDMASDSDACIYSTEADGADVVLDILNGNGTSSDYVDIQNSQNHRKAKVDGCLINCGTPPPSLNGVRRSWRQLFMRQK